MNSSSFFKIALDLSSFAHQEPQDSVQSLARLIELSIFHEPQARGLVLQEIETSKGVEFGDLFFFEDQGIISLTQWPSSYSSFSLL